MKEKINLKDQINFSAPEICDFKIEFYDGSSQSPNQTEESVIYDNQKILKITYDEVDREEEKFNNFISSSCKWAPIDLQKQSSVMNTNSSSFNPTVSIGNE